MKQRNQSYQRYRTSLKMAKLRAEERMKQPDGITYELGAF